MKVEDTFAGRVPFFEIGPRDADARHAPVTLAEQLATVTVSPRRKTQDTHDARNTLATSISVVPQQLRTDPPFLGPTLGVDFRDTLRSLHAQLQYQSAVKLMADKLVEFVNNKPSGWHFDLHPQAESAMENFYLNHLSPQLRERYEKKKADGEINELNVRKFSRLFFFASSTQLPRERLNAYARRSMEVETKLPKTPYVKARIQGFMKRSKPHLSISRDAYTALIIESPKICGANFTDNRTAALFCASGFAQLINHIIFETIAHPDARVHMHIPYAKPPNFDAQLRSMTEFFASPVFDADYIVNIESSTSLRSMSLVKLSDTIPVQQPSAPSPPSPSFQYWSD